MPSRTPPCASSTASTIDRRLGSQPTTARRGVPSDDRRDQRLDLDQQRPRAFHAGEHRRARRSRDRARRGTAPRGWRPRARPRVRSSRRRRSRRSAPKRFLTARRMRKWWPRVALEIEHRVDHVLDDARAGDLAVLGDVADEDDGRAAGLGEADQRLRRAAHLGDRAGRRFDACRSTCVWIESMIDERRRRALGERGEDVLDIGLGGELDRRVARARAARRAAAPARPPPRPRRRRRGRPCWRAPRRPASAASTCRCRDRRRSGSPSRGTKPPPVTRSSSPMPDGDARRLVRLAGKRLRAGTTRPFAPARARRDRAASRCAAPVSSTMRVPLAAGVAAALPAVVDGAAALADEGRLGLGHVRSLRSPALRREPRGGRARRERS